MSRIPPASMLPVVFLLAACAGNRPPPSMNLNAQPSVDGLYPVDNTRFGLAEVKPDMDLSGYTEFMLDDVQVAYKKQPGPQLPGQRDNFALTNRQMQNFEDTFRDQIQQALTENDGYTLVTEPGPDVLRLDAYLLDLQVDYDPEGYVGRNQEYVTRYGAVTMILELRDSESGEILARVGSRQDAMPNNRYATIVSPSMVQSDVLRMFRGWAQLVRERLDAVRQADFSDAVNTGS